jgi:adenylate cyclase
MKDRRRMLLRDNGDLSDSGPLPERVDREIKARESSAEILIGWCQLAIVLFFGILYAVAPRAEGSQGFNFVPIALTLYFVFTLARLFLSYRMELPGWYLVLSIITDVLLLFGIIFSFHIQYDQHPTFYLKSPTVMYIFLFIVLRALRFDAKYVLITGAIAVLGWLALVGYAVLSDPDGMYITRNYVDYLTNNAILFGAEIDKIMIIITVTGVLALALHRGRQLLIAAVREHTAAEELKRFFSPEIARSIADADEQLHAGQGTMRDVAVLVVDVRNFTAATAALSPETVMAILSRYQAVAVPVIQQLGGRVDKFLGDGILATFGAVQPSQTYAADAVRAAIELVGAVGSAGDEFLQDGWSGPFEIGCAVACGPVNVGIVGVESRLEYTVIGDAVNVATKLEQANKVESTRALTNRGCFELARSQGFTPSTDFNWRYGRSVQGIDAPVDLVALA